MQHCSFASTWIAETNELLIFCASLHLHGKANSSIWIRPIWHLFFTTKHTKIPKSSVVHIHFPKWYAICYRNVSFLLQLIQSPGVNIWRSRGPVATEWRMACSELTRGSWGFLKDQSIFRNAFFFASWCRVLYVYIYICTVLLIYLFICLLMFIYLFDLFTFWHNVEMALSIMDQNRKQMNNIYYTYHVVIAIYIYVYIDVQKQDLFSMYIHTYIHTRVFSRLCTNKISIA